ncbi:hypothetical protein SDC9_152344 [bioreactor metagenome]|uniref:Uncharacterized protein n=1 Tax=bioreactor metagenome TaxID=1076179 RepID=A0A645EXC6_9ZZZZ
MRIAQQHQCRKQGGNIPALVSKREERRQADAKLERHIKIAQEKHGAIHASAVQQAVGAEHRRRQHAGELMHLPGINQRAIPL